MCECQSAWHNARVPATDKTLAALADARSSARCDRLYIRVVAEPRCCLALAGDGFIDAKDLRSFLGPAANVESLIKQASNVPAAHLTFTAISIVNVPSGTLLPHPSTSMTHSRIL